jgi:hypothetical protein
MDEKQSKIYLHGYDVLIDGVGEFQCPQLYGFAIDLRVVEFSHLAVDAPLNGR